MQFIKNWEWNGITSVMAILAPSALAIIGALVLEAQFRPPPVKSVVFMLGKWQCDPNEGLKEVVAGSRFAAERKYSFTCNNSAQFLDQIIPDDLQPTPALVLNTNAVKAKEVIK